MHVELPYDVMHWTGLGIQIKVSDVCSCILVLLYQYQFLLASR